MRVDCRLSLIERDVTAHAKHFVLTHGRDLPVHFALRIKPSQRRPIHRSNSGEMRARNVILLRELQQSGKSLVARVEDDLILFRWFLSAQQLNLHPGSFCLSGQLPTALHIRLLFLRTGTEHHSIGLFPKELRDELGLSAQTTCMSFGIEVGNYEQLRSAVRFFREKGSKVVDRIPPELYPGIDYAAHVQGIGGP